MLIGELAKRFSLNPKTIRYYEEIGLLPRPKRTASGYRQYDENVVAHLAFIQRAKLLGLSLEEVREILAISQRGEQPCEQVLELIDAELARVDHRLAELTRLRAELATLREEWSEEALRRPGAACLCPIIEEQTAVTMRPLFDRTLGTERRARL